MQHDNFRTVVVVLTLLRSLCYEAQCKPCFLHVCMQKSCVQSVELSHACYSLAASLSPFCPDGKNPQSQKFSINTRERILTQAEHKDAVCQLCHVSTLLGRRRRGAPPRCPPHRSAAAARWGLPPGPPHRFPPCCRLVRPTAMHSQNSRPELPHRR